MIRQWWKWHFNVRVGANVAGEPGDFERCSCCGQTYNTRDLQQVLPHFEHQLGLSVQAPNVSISDEDVQAPVRNIVPFRRRAPA